MDGGKRRRGFPSFPKEKFRKSYYPFFASPPLFVKERGIKGVRIVKDKRLEMSRGRVVEWGRNRLNIQMS